jgi:hypothetical protein
MRFAGDVDILMDFPPDALDDPWNFAESACWDRHLETDITPFSWCKAAFLAHIEPDLEVIAWRAHWIEINKVVASANLAQQLPDAIAAFRLRSTLSP